MVEEPVYISSNMGLGFPFLHFSHDFLKNHRPNGCVVISHYLNVFP